MEPQSLRIRLMIEDRSILSKKQRILGMNHSWLLIESNQHPKISDVCNHLLRMSNLRSSCPNGILLFMEGFVLPPSESTRILKDNDIICVKRKQLTLGKVTEGADACNLLDEGEINRLKPVDNGMLLLENEEFDKETGGCESESEEEKLEEEALTKVSASKKRKASTKPQSSKKKQKRSVVMDDVSTEDGIIPMKKIKANMEKKSVESEINVKKVKSLSKVKRKKKHCSRVVNGADDVVVTVEIDNVNNGEEVKQESTAPDGAKKGPSRSARRKKAKRKAQKATNEPSTMLTADTQVPLVDLIDFDQLPLCSSPKEDDVIAYRLLELTSYWAFELSSFRVGKVSNYDGNKIVLMLVPEYPIDEDVLQNSLYNKDGSLEIKFAGLVDVRSVKQINSETIKSVSNGINQTPQGDDKDAASNLFSSSNGNKTNLSKDPSPGVIEHIHG